MQADACRRDHAEVAAAAAQRPQQVRVVVAVGADEGTVGEHDLGGDEVVGGQPEATAQAAVPAAEREPDDADTAARAGDGGQPERLCGRQEVGSGRARLDGGLALRGVDRDGPHAGDVDDQAAVPNGAAGPVVTGGPDRQRQAALAGGPYGGLDVGCRGASRHDRGPPAYSRVPERGGVVVDRARDSHPIGAENAAE
jgi:hypothetical protein